MAEITWERLLPLQSEKTALRLLGLKWKRDPEPCHDYLLFLTRSSDSKYLATASSETHIDHVTEIWNVEERSMLRRLETPNAGTMSLDWISSDRFVTVGHDCVLSIWTGDQVLSRYLPGSLSGHQGWIKSIATTATLAVSGDADSTIGIWDLQTEANRRLLVHPNHNEMDLNVIMDVTFLPDSETCFYLVQRSNRLSLGDVRTQRLIQWSSAIDMTKPTKIKSAETTHQVFISARRSEIKLWDVRVNTPHCVQFYSQHRAETLPVEFDLLGYGKYLATGSDDGCAYIYATATGRLLRTIKLGHGLVQSCCAESPDSLSFYVSFNNSQCLGVVDTVGADVQCHSASVEEINNAYRANAWNAALGTYTKRLVVHLQHLLGEQPYSRGDWFHVLQTSRDPESQELCALISREYQRQLEAVDSLVSDEIKACLRRTENPAESRQSLPSEDTRRSSEAPRVRKDTTCTPVTASKRRKFH